MAISNVTVIACDWCGHAEQRDGSGHGVIRAAHADGWLTEDGEDFCGEVCREKARKRAAAAAA